MLLNTKERKEVVMKFLSITKNIAAVSALAIGLLFSAASQAVLITQSVTDQGNDVFKIDFTVENTSGTEIDEFIVYFDDTVDSLVEPTIGEFVFTTPTGWQDLSDGGFNSILASTPPSYSAFTDLTAADFAPIGLNEMLTGFSILVNTIAGTELSTSFEFEAFFDLDLVADGLTTTNVTNASAPAAIWFVVLGLSAFFVRRASVK
jgi:hypothetical protein